MKKHPLAVTALLVASLVAGCAAPPGQQKEQAGTVIGAVVGGLVGSQIGEGSGAVAATVVGALAGGAIGRSVGRSMDETDRMRTAQALESARTGVPTTWINPDSGVQYTVTPTRTYETASAGPCREYTMDSMVGGKPEKVYGTACRQPDGSWRVQN